MQAYATAIDVDGPSSQVERAAVAARLATLTDAVGATMIADTSSLVQQMSGVTSLDEKRDVEQRLHAIERALAAGR